MDERRGSSSRRNGLGEAILHYLVTMLGEGGEFAWCVGKVVEWRRLDEVIKEQKFQQSKYADPATAIRKPGTLVPDFLIGGRITFGAGKADWTIETRTNPSGDIVDSFTGFSLTGGGFSGVGSGTYTIGSSGDSFTLTIKQTTKGCINGVPGSCKTNSEVLTLTPVSR